MTTTTDAKVVADHTYYMVVVGYSSVLLKDTFKIINKKWGVEALEVANEKLALYLCSQLDKSYNKTLEEAVVSGEDAEVAQDFAAFDKTKLN